MSNAVYPTLPGLAWPVTRTPLWRTTVQTTPSGREWRTSAMAFPRYRYTLTYEFLRSTAAYPHLQTLLGFFNSRRGGYDSFLFSDPDDRTVTAQAFGTGDGVSTQWQLVRTLGGFVEPVYALDGAPQIMVDGVPTNLLLGGADLQTWMAGFGLSVQPNVAANPVTGVVDVDRLIDSSTTEMSANERVVSVPNDTATYVLSFYVAKTSGGTSKTLYAACDFNGGLTPSLTHPRIDTDSGVFLSGAGVGSSISSVGSFWRVSVVVANNGTGNTRINVVICPAAAAHGLTSLDATQTGSADIWGVKLERGSAATPFIDMVATVSDSGAVTFSAPPPAGTVLSWTGGYYWRCRFEDDDLDLEQFLAKLWKTGQVMLLTVKP